MRAILRFLGFLATVGGFIALVIDVTRFMANHIWRPATLLDALSSVAPNAGASLPAAAENLAGALAERAVTATLSAPACIAGLIAGFALMYIFRQRPRDGEPDF